MCQLFHPIEFGTQLFLALVGQPVCLLITRGILLIDRFNPRCFHEPSYGAVQRSGAQPNTAEAQALNVFDQGISMTGFVRKARQDQKHGLGQGFMLTMRHDMSHGDILKCSRRLVNSVPDCVDYTNHPGNPRLQPFEIRLSLLQESADTFGLVFAPEGEAEQVGFPIEAFAEIRARSGFHGFFRSA